MSTKLKKEYRHLVSLVKKQLTKEGRPARNEDIAQVLGYTRSYFSTLLGERSNVNEDHIRLLKLHFPFLSNERIERTDREILLSIEKMLKKIVK